VNRISSKKSIKKIEDTHVGNTLGIPFATSIAENKNFCLEKKLFSFSASVFHFQENFIITFLSLNIDFFNQYLEGFYRYIKYVSNVMLYS
jgi:hypothetical protein